MNMLKRPPPPPKALSISSKPSAHASAQGEMHREMQSRISDEMRGLRLDHLRLTMKAADLGLVMVRYDKAQVSYPHPYPYP
jgi:hypothetical protein